MIAVGAVASGHIYRIHLKVKAWNSFKLCFPRYSIDRNTDLERFFNIESTTGVISTAKPLDREANAVHNITILAIESCEWPQIILCNYWTDLYGCCYGLKVFWKFVKGTLTMIMFLGWNKELNTKYATWKRPDLCTVDVLWYSFLLFNKVCQLQKLILLELPFISKPFKRIFYWKIPLHSVSMGKYWAAAFCFLKSQILLGWSPW